ncbi:MAG: tRNA lysidine(34) synthetase TilS [Bacteroidota bacterium]
MPTNSSSVSKHQKILQSCLEKHHPISKNEQILVGISGGPDSVYLAFLLYTMGYKISLAHVNYGLRNLDSIKEEELVFAYSKDWKVPIYIKRENPKDRMLDSGASLQQIARNIRYSFFEELMDEHDIGHCAIAHHADDQVESILMSLIKGNADRVIHAIPISRENYLRPMTELSRAEIMEGIKEAELSYSHDISNDSNDYLRNQIRNQVLPLLEEINPSIRSQLLRKEELYQQQKHSLNLYGSNYLAKGLISSYHFSWEDIEKEISPEQLDQILIQVLKNWGLHGNDLWNSLALKDSLSGKMILTAQGKVIKDRKAFILNKEEKRTRVDHYRIERWLGKESFELGNWEIELEEVKEADFSKEGSYYFCLDNLNFPISFRIASPGDKMKPLGMKQHKKLSDIMIDAKWSQPRKEQAIIMEDLEKICLLIDFRISEEIKLSNTNQRIIELSFRSI